MVPMRMTLSKRKPELRNVPGKGTDKPNEKAETNVDKKAGIPQKIKVDILISVTKKEITCKMHNSTRAGAVAI